jgi:hypothetical protein
MLQHTWCISMLHLSYLMPFLRQKSLAGYNHHPSQQPTLSLALLLPLHHVPLSCMQLLSCQACHSLPSISSPAPLLLLTLIASLVISARKGAYHRAIYWPEGTLFWNPFGLGPRWALYHFMTMVGLGSLLFASKKIFFIHSLMLSARFPRLTTQ